jgi:hypothetical protein
LSAYSPLSLPFLFVAFISYLFNWFTGGTDDIFSGISFSRVMTDKALETHNLGGRLGAGLSTLLIKQGFGVGTLLLVIWLFIVGVRLSSSTPSFPSGKASGLPSS